MSSESGNKLEKGYQPAVREREECSSGFYAAEPTARDKLQLCLNVCLVYFSKVRCTASPFDLLEGDLREFVYTAVVHQRSGPYGALQCLIQYHLQCVVSVLLKVKWIVLILTWEKMYTLT